MNTHVPYFKTFFLVQYSKYHNQSQFTLLLLKNFHSYIYLFQIVYISRKKKCITLYQIAEIKLTCPHKLV